MNKRDSSVPNIRTKPLALNGGFDISGVSIDKLMDEVKRTRKFIDTAPADEILAQLFAIAAIDKESESRRRNFGLYATLSGLLGLLTLFLAIPTVGITLVIAIPSIICCGVMIVKWSSAAKTDVLDRHYIFPLEILKRIKPDISPLVPVSIEVDFNHYHDAKYRTENSKGGAFSSVRTSKYEIAWLLIQGQFMDGTKFKFRISNNIKRKEKHKSKGTKVTESFREKYNLLLIPSPDRYPNLTPFSPAFNQQYKRCRKLIAESPEAKTVVNDGRISMQALTNVRRHVYFNSVVNSPFPGILPDTPLELFQAAYAALHQLPSPSQGQE